MNRLPVLYGNAVSTYCTKVRVVLHEKSIAVEEREPPGGYGSSAYREIVPIGFIPAWVDGDLVLSESEVIVEYLNECYPEPALLPPTPSDRARARMLSRFHDLHVEPLVRSVFPHVKGRDVDVGFLRAQAQKLTSKLELLATIKEPEDYLAGPQFSLADCAYPGTIMHAQCIFKALDIPFTVPQTLTPWLDRLARRPSVERAVKPCAAAMQKWLDMKLTGKSD